MKRGSRAAMASSSRAQLRGRDDLALGVVGVGLDAPGTVKLIDLPPVHHEGNGLGRLAERDRQEAGGQRVERAGMAGLLGVEQARLTTATRWVEVMPTGLSSTTQPCTSHFLGAGPGCPPGSQWLGVSQLSSRSSSSWSWSIVGRWRASRGGPPRLSQQRVDALGIVEALVERGSADPARISVVHAMGDHRRRY